MQPQLTTRRHGVWWLVPTSLGGLMLLLLVWGHGVLAELGTVIPLPCPRCTPSERDILEAGVCSL